jgi:inorganic pyrophosphatase
MSLAAPSQGSQAFWQALDLLVKSHEIIIDRPRGTAHPRYPDNIYPLDYGYLQGTSANDGSGIDVWVGTIEGRHVCAVIVNIDLCKHDSEIKILLGCTPKEMGVVLEKHNVGLQSAILIEREYTPTLKSK